MLMEVAVAEIKVVLQLLFGGAGGIFLDNLFSVEILIWDVPNTNLVSKLVFELFRTFY
jgi:hypothetical protein